MHMTDDGSIGQIGNGLRDCVYGAAIGDALGVPYEFKIRGLFRCKGMVEGGTHGQPAGTWSDDTALMLATCDSIRVTGRIDIDDMRRRFTDWYRHGAYTPDGAVFDVGGTTARALDSGIGGSDEMDNGNGSLMRIAPLAFCDATEEEVAAVSAITHAHETSTSACIRLVRMLRTLMRNPQGIMFKLRSTYAERTQWSVHSDGFVEHTLDAALWCLASTDGYADCVLRAVNLGHDTDTTACVAGTLAGVAYGFDAIPDEWVSGLRGKDILEKCLF